jgi:hypothetical protein
MAKFAKEIAHVVIFKVKLVLMSMVKAVQA